MSEDKRSCENCGNIRCRNSIIAFWWDECVESDFTKHWIPITKQIEKGEQQC